MKNNLPLVTIAIPNYNYARYLAQSIKSALNQTYPNKEIILVDNASTDNSMEVASNYKDFIKIYQNEKNIGFVGNLNRCTELANGEFIVFLCSDDTLETTFVEKCVNVFLSKDVGIVYTAYNWINDQNIILKKINNYKENKFFLKGEEAIVNLLTVGTGSLSLLMIKKELIVRTNGFNEEIQQPADTLKWCEIAQFANVYYINENLCNYRVHEKQLTVEGLTDETVFLKQKLLIDLVTKFKVIKSDTKKIIYKKYYDHLADMMLMVRIYGNKKFYFANLKQLIKIDCKYIIHKKVIISFISLIFPSKLLRLLRNKYRREKN